MNEAHLIPASQVLQVSSTVTHCGYPQPLAVSSTVALDYYSNDLLEVLLMHFLSLTVQTNKILLL